MHLSLIQEGEELEKRAAIGPWYRVQKRNLCTVENSTEMITMTMDEEGRYGTIDENDAGLVCFLRNNAHDLLEAARWAVENGYTGV